MPDGYDKCLRQDRRTSQGAAAQQPKRPRKMIDSAYSWEFHSTTGDAWYGVTYANTGSYTNGGQYDTGGGRYYITGELPYGVDYGFDSTGINYVYSYYDWGTGMWYSPDNYSAGGT